MRPALFALALAALVGCSAQPHSFDPEGLRVIVVPRLDGGPSPQDAGTHDAGTLDAGTQDAGTLDAGERWEIPIRVLLDAMGPTRIYCLARQGDAGVALLVDTGSQLSFLTTPAGSPDYIADAGRLWLGGRERVMPGRPYAVAESIDTLPVIGFLGNDFFFEAPTELDLDAQLIRRSDAPWDAGGWTALPYENRSDYMFVLVELDQVTQRLGFDTGAGHTLLLDAGAQPGDQAVSTQDAYGNQLTLYLGTTLLSFDGGVAKTVPLLRAPSFPSLEDSNRALGGSPINGLFGLSSVGGGVIRIDAPRSTIWLR